MLTMRLQNTAPDGKRAASIGIALSIGNIGGIISGQICESTLPSASVHLELGTDLFSQTRNSWPRPTHSATPGLSVPSPSASASGLCSATSTTAVKVTRSKCARTPISSDRMAAYSAIARLSTSTSIKE